MDPLLATYGVAVMGVVATLAWAFMVFRRLVSKLEAIVLLIVYVVAILMISNLKIGQSIRAIFEGFA